MALVVFSELEKVKLDVYVEPVIVVDLSTVVDLVWLTELVKIKELESDD